MQPDGTTLPDSAARAARVALEATFRQPAYDRAVRDTLWSRILQWIGEQFERLWHGVSGSPPVAYTVLAVITLAVVAFGTRAAYLAARRREGAHGSASRSVATRDADPWQVATALAAQGDYTAAAHALYAALIARLAQRERLHRHPSKTAGDYTRDLRAIGSSAHAPFRRFARDYDLVVYGLGTCDAPRYARLLGAANAVLPLTGGAHG